ncbi:MAG: hypothetical protein K940chlam1_01364, partial [Candidatus Anoxychlamydiales bacterium]|nr:hypothetical protein [Candidatus Anoxychlamydiales bacterium]
MLKFFFALFISVYICNGFSDEYGFENILPFEKKFHVIDLDDQRNDKKTDEIDDSLNVITESKTQTKDDQAVSKEDQKKEKTTINEKSETVELENTVQQDEGVKDCSDDTNQSQEPFKEIEEPKIVKSEKEKSKKDKKNQTKIKTEVSKQDTDDKCDDIIDSQKHSENKILIDSLKGIILIGSLEDLKTNTQNIEGVVIENVDVPGETNELKEKLKSFYLNKALTKEVIHQIKKEIISYYKYYDRPVVTVLIPKQNISDNVLQIIILESKIDKIYV